MELEIADGVRQADLLRERSSPYAERAKLTAVRQIGSGRRGRIWLTKCDCGNLREMDSERFTSGFIHQCEICANREPARTSFYSRAFRRNWREIMGGLDAGQMLLLETIMDGRPRCDYYLMQATDIVIRAGEDIEYELASFSRDRILRAKRKLEKNLSE